MSLGLGDIKDHWLSIKAIEVNTIAEKKCCGVKKVIKWKSAEG